MKDVFLVLYKLINTCFSCQNRDKEQKLKTGMMGGYLRTRTGSWTQRRAQRPLVREDFNETVGITRELPDKIARKLMSRGVVEAVASKVAEAAVAVFTKIKKDNSKDGFDRKAPSTESMFRLTDAEFDVLADAVYANREALSSWYDACSKNKDKDKKVEIDPKVKSAILKFASVGGATSPECALYGRFLPDTDLSGMTVTGAVETAHMFGCNELVLIRDYFVAMDDVTGKTGCGNDHQDLSSDLMNGFECINLGQAVRNQGGTKRLLELVESAVRAYALAQPGAKKTSTGERGLPILLRAVITPLPISATDAFENPIVPINGLTRSAIGAGRLFAHAERAYLGYGRKGVKLDAYYWTGEPLPKGTDKGVSVQCEGLDALIKQIRNNIPLEVLAEQIKKNAV